MKNAKKNRGFVRNISIPRGKVLVMQAALNDARAEAQSLRNELAGVSMNRWKQQKRADNLKEELVLYIASLRDAVKIIDEERAGTKSGWSRDDAKKLEALRALSLFGPFAALREEMQR